ncbi:DoxX family protein [Campylobacter sp. RM12327]|uniref:DoxX family protein n=1 Tax=Campylobacter sputorum TaxID=206 RepID=UPI000B77106D|nr:MULTISPECIES: DoxX family protein [Campylobacter]ASM40743.1 DoxX family protein [Campylobacter sputorum]MBE7357956.1 DoxX family protein [Campylobacter sp. RM11302]MBF6669642.1 DoxX family protein [Campylobacter sp. RM12327]MBF6674886.1 DoxX family protein [Campylobacter sp. RM13538]MBF6676519.1 DoxX family protein [Campylobacter sp. RM12321]
MKFVNSHSIGLLFLRVFLGICVLMHGIFKLNNGIAGVKSMLVASGLPQIMSYGVYIGEVLAPLMIIFGVFTRFAAFILFGTCCVIFYVANASAPFALTSNGGFVAEILYLYIGCAICLIFCGGGKFSLTKDY